MVKLILIFVAILAFVAGLWIVALTIHFRYQANVSMRRFTSPAPSAVPIDHGKKMVSMDVKWRRTAFDTIMTVDFTFTNRSPYQAKDITVTCTHFAPSGTEIDSNTRTIYEVIPAKGVKQVKDFDMGFIHSQVVSTVCKIDDFDM